MPLLSKTWLSRTFYKTGLFAKKTVNILAKCDVSVPNRGKNILQP